MPWANTAFAANWQQAKALGIVRGAYHFAHPKNGAATDSGAFLDTVRPHGLTAGDLLALDLEVSDGLSPARVAEYARNWCADVQKATGHTPVVYTFLSFAQQGNCAGLGGYPLWISDPSSPAGHPRVPAPWSTWALHQYATTGNIDRDVSSYATPAAMRAALGKGTTILKTTRKDPEMILVEVDRATVPAGTAWPGVFLLTSDGLTRYAKPEDIAGYASPEAELSTICQSLIDHAKRGGGADNITCMMLRVVEAPSIAEMEVPAAEI